eukprot:3722515-Rhodomonas_salina.1
MMEPQAEPHCSGPGWQWPGPGGIDFAHWHTASLSATRTRRRAARASLSLRPASSLEGPRPTCVTVEPNQNRQHHGIPESTMTGKSS